MVIEEQRFVRRHSVKDRIATDLSTTIEANSLPAGSKLPSIRELCIQYSASTITVRAALQNLCERGRIYSRHGAGFYVAAPEQPRVQSIGLIVPSSEDLFSAHLIAGAEEACRAGGFQLVLAQSREELEIETECVRDMVSFVAGAVIMPSKTKANYEGYIPLFANDIPFAFVDRSVHGLACPLVCTDNEQGGYLAASHLLEQGIDDIYALVERSSSGFSSARLRLRGYRAALENYGRPIDERRILTSDAMWDEAGYILTQALLASRQAGSPRRIGLFAINDYVARGAYRAVRKCGLRIPEDVAVVGFDDLVAEHLDPPLTTVRQDVRAIGARGVQIVIDRIQAAEDDDAEQYCPPILLKPSLVVRDSSVLQNERRLLASGVI